MDARPEPTDGVAAIYSGTLVVFLVLLSAALEPAPYSQVFILTPGIRVFLILGGVGWVLVVWAMATGRASTNTEQIVVLVTFTYGALSEVNKDLQLCNRLEWDYDLLAGVAWGQLISTHREAVLYEQRLEMATATQLAADIRSLYVRLVAAPTVALPSAWCRCVHMFFVLQERMRHEAAAEATAPDTAERASGVASSADPDATPPSEADQPSGAVQQDRVRRQVSFRFIIRAMRDVVGSLNPRSVYFGVLRGSLLLSGLPLLLLFWGSLWLQYCRASAALRYKVQPDFGRHLARRWLRHALLGPPHHFLHSRAWDLWMLASAITEKRAGCLLRHMSCPQGMEFDAWGEDAARKAVGKVTGVEAYRDGRPPRGRAWGISRSVLFFPLRQWRRLFPTNRELFFKFVLAALNVDGGKVGARVCTINDVIDGNEDRLAALFSEAAEAVRERWEELREELVIQGVLVLPRGSDDGGSPSDGVDPEQATAPPQTGNGGMAGGWGGSLPDTWTAFSQGGGALAS